MATPGAAATAAPSAATGHLTHGRITFARLRGNPEGDYLGTFAVGPDDVEQQLTLPIDNDWFSGSWSPDGASLLINAFTGDRLVVGMFDPTSQTFTEVTPSGMAGELECTDWTPDATHVICGRSGPDPANDGIYSVDVATGDATRLTTSAYHHVVGTSGECGGGEGRAVYAPDGSRFAYVQQQCGTGPNPSSDEQGAIAVATADGSTSAVVVPLGGVRTHPGGEISWSPTEDLIAFGTQGGSLSLVAPDGSGLRTVPLPVTGFAYGPSWSPDGDSILVTIIDQATNQHDLYVVTPDGSSATGLTDTPEVEAFTDWGFAQ